MDNNTHNPEKDNIFDILTGHRVGAKPLQPRIVRISPEVDGISMLYSNFTSTDKLYSMKLVCWALR